MEILIKKLQSNLGWKRAQQRHYESESALQQILYDSPEIIPIETVGAGAMKPIIFVKETGLPGSGFTDLIGIDETGGITIIECKLAANREIRRKVIGQVLEYAAFLWGMSYEEFERQCCKAEKWEGKNLTDVIKDKLEPQGKPFSVEDFKANMESNLREGDFRLIIAVDELDPELKRIIEYINTRGDSSAKIYPLTLKQFENSEQGLEVLVPEISSFIPSVKSTLKMNEKELLKQCSTRCRELYLSLKELSSRDEFKNSGYTNKGYAFRLTNVGNLLMLYPDYLNMWFGPHHSDFLDEKTDEQFWRNLAQINVFKDKLEKKNPEVVINDETWSKSEVHIFISAIGSFARE
jgi:hypothetical protein